MISESYKKQLEQLHREQDDWGTTATWVLEPVLECIKEFKVKTLLDYGAGKVALSRSLVNTDLEIFEYDPGIPEKSNTPDPADFVCCIDVLEHVESDQVDSVLKDLQRVIKDKGFFLISLIPALAKLPDGRNAHITLESPEWWCNKVEEYLTINKGLVYPLVEHESFEYFDQTNYPYHHLRLFVSQKAENNS